VVNLKGVGIGAGYFAPFQYEAWTRIPDVTIAAISNRTEASARELMDQYGVARYYASTSPVIVGNRPPL
jgi:predicted dehydrogenase